jgi:hypothetical protein
VLKRRRGNTAFKVLIEENLTGASRPYSGGFIDILHIGAQYPYQIRLVAGVVINESLACRKV